MGLKGGREKREGIEVARRTPGGGGGDDGSIILLPIPFVSGRELTGSPGNDRKHFGREPKPDTLVSCEIVNTRTLSCLFVSLILLSCV